MITDDTAPCLTIIEEDIAITAADGLRLHARCTRPAVGETGCPVICLAGLSRNGRDFTGIARRIAGQAEGARRVIALDSRGRGGSARDPDPSHYTVVQETQDVQSLLQALGIQRAVFIGTSRGGLILHVLAALQPDAIVAAILNDIGPVIEIGGLLAIRDALSTGKSPGNRAEAETMLRQRYGAQFPALSPANWTAMTDAIFADREGTLVADFDPAIVAPLMALTLETELPDLWPQFDALAAKPLLILRGETSDILSAATAGEMHRRAGARSTLFTVPGQGHVPLLDTEPTASAIVAFLASDAVA